MSAYVSLVPIYLHLPQGAFHVGRRHARHRARLLRAVGRLHDRVRSTLNLVDAFSSTNRESTSPENATEEITMTFDYSLAALVTAGLMIYLTYALLKPERF